MPATDPFPPLNFFTGFLVSLNLYVPTLVRYHGYGTFENADHDHVYDEIQFGRIWRHCHDLVQYATHVLCGIYVSPSTLLYVCGANNCDGIFEAEAGSMDAAHGQIQGGKGADQQYRHDAHVREL